MPPDGPVALREVRPSDFDVFFHQQDDPEANTMAAFPARTHEEVVAHWQRILANPSGFERTIVVGDTVVGNIVSWLQDGHREIGYWIGREHWGRGVATAAVSAFLEIVTERPLFAYVAEHNVGSIRVLEKCGFTPSDEQPETAEGDTLYVVMERRE